MNVSIKDLMGKTLTKIDDSQSNVLIFHCSDGEKYKMHHHQDCCESVDLAQIDGKLEDLIESPILQAEEETQEGDVPDGWGDHYTWTFYKFATVKGYVTLRWNGSSNGYYSESVDFERITE